MVGNDAEIVAYQRNNTSGSQNYMNSFMGNTKLMDPVTDFIPASMVGLMDAVATYNNAENAIGYSVYAYAADMYGNGNEIKFIKVDGVEPTKATMASNEYPLLNYNYAIYDKSKVSTTTVDELVEWILTYDGQVAMANAGYIPIKNIKVEELEIVPYTQKGTGIEKPENYVLDTYCYNVESEFILKDNKLIGLNNKDLQDEINTFISDSISKLNTQKQELDNYLDLLNADSDNYGYNFKFSKNTGPIDVSLECINGYLSIQVSLVYAYQVQDGTPYIYDGYSAIYDLYTGEKLELSDLYFKDVDFISDVNNKIKFFENHTYELTPARTFKRTFTSVPENISMYSLSTIGFTKFNPYFAQGEIFELDNYSNAINKVIYQARDMKNIWDSSIEINKDFNSFSFEGEYKEQEKDDVIYYVQYIDTNNENVDSKINSYIDNYIKTKASFENINKFVESNPDEISNNDGTAFIISFYGSTIGNKIAHINIELGMGTSFDKLLFDLKTGELLDITYEEWYEQNKP